MPQEITEHTTQSSDPISQPKFDGIRSRVKAPISDSAANKAVKQAETNTEKKYSADNLLARLRSLKSPPKPTGQRIVVDSRAESNIDRTSGNTPKTDIERRASSSKLTRIFEKVGYKSAETKLVAQYHTCLKNVDALLGTYRVKILEIAQHYQHIHDSAARNGQSFLADIDSGHFDPTTNTAFHQHLQKLFAQQPPFDDFYIDIDNGLQNVDASKDTYTFAIRKGDKDGILHTRHRYVHEKARRTYEQFRYLDLWKEITTDYHDVAQLMLDISQNNTILLQEIDTDTDSIGMQESAEEKDLTREIETFNQHIGIEHAQIPDQSRESDFKNAEAIRD